MLGWSAVGARFAVLGTSAALHAGLGAAFVLVGHGAPASGSAPSELPIEVVDETSPSPVVEPREEEEHAHSVSAHSHSHTHPYPVVASHDATPHDPSIVHAPLGVPPQSDPAPAPDVVAAPAAPARFAMSLGKAAVATGAASSPIGAGGHAADPGATEILPDANAAVPAHLLYGPPPPYPADARAAEIEAEVPLEIVVDARGTVTDARVTRYAGYGLDEAAVRAVRAYRFVPARRGDRAVAVRMHWSMEFRLR
jgi:protein TonB